MHASPLLIAIALGALSPLAARAATPVADADNGGLKLPPGFRAVVVAEGLGEVRFVAVAPNGDIYGKIHNGGLVALRDADGDGRAEVKEKFGSGSGSGIAVHDGWLYYSTNSAVYRYRLEPGQLVPAGEPETIVSGLPDRREHNTKAFTFGADGQLYVEVGSPSNALGNPDRGPHATGSSPEQVAEFQKHHGGFWRFDPNKTGQTQADGFHFSTGHRHILAVAWNPAAQALFVVMNGRDVLNVVAPDFYTAQDNAERVAEEMHVLREGANLGWPYTYFDPVQHARMVGPEYGGDGKKRAESGKYPDPLIAFPAHWAPMQMTFYTADKFPAKYRGGAFVAFHGSWNRAPEPQRGYNVTFVPFTAQGMPAGNYEVFADGFAGQSEIRNPNQARARPCGVAVAPDGSLIVGDDQGGRVWRIFYAGE